MTMLSKCKTQWPILMLCVIAGLVMHPNVSVSQAAPSRAQANWASQAGQRDTLSARPASIASAPRQNVSNTQVKIESAKPEAAPSNASAQQAQATWGTPVSTSYYTFNGQRVAMRRCAGTCSSSNPGTVTWIHGDMLGSASITTDASGAKTSEQRYTPFGTPRLANTLPTSRTWTGQLDVGFGAMEFGGGTRLYSPLFGRFLSADTVVPGVGNPQALNRYAYALNNPLKFTDPTGHAQSCDEGPTGCGDWGTTLVNLQQFGALPGKNVAALPYLFYKDPSKFKFTASIEFDDVLGPNREVILSAEQSQRAATTIANATGQGGIAAFDKPGMEDYPADINVYDDADGNTHFDRSIIVGGKKVPMFIGTFDAAILINGKRGILETLPLSSNTSATLHLETSFGSKSKSVIEKSNTVQLTVDTAQFFLPPNMPFYVKFETTQTSDTQIRTVGGLYVQAPGRTDFQRVGAVTFNGTYGP